MRCCFPRCTASSTPSCCRSGSSPIDSTSACSCRSTSTSGVPKHVESRAVVLLSGGLDSYTAAAVAKREGFTLFALSINYGQRHSQELEASRTVARSLGVAQHLELNLDLTRIGGSSLTSSTIDVPKDQPIDPTQIPSTYV